MMSEILIAGSAVSFCLAMFLIYRKARDSFKGSGF